MNIVKLTLFLFLFASFAVAEEAVPVKLNMVRPCNATVWEREKDYIVTAEILPIKCFNPTTNRDISFRKAENVAFYALLTYLQPNKKNAAISCQNSRVYERTFKDNSCSVVCQIPKKGLKILDVAQISSKGVKEKTGTKIIVNSSSILTLKNDYLETIRQFREVTIQKFPEFPGEAKNLDQFYMKLYDLEQEMVSQLKDLEKVIRTEKHLLETEKKELLPELEAVKSELTQILQYYAELASILEQNPKFKVKSEFAESVLLSSMFNTETEGVQLIELPKGNFVLAVGIATVPEERETEPGLWKLQKRKLLRKAELRARAQMAKEIHGEQVESRETLKESVKITFDGKNERAETFEEYTHRIQTSSQAFLENLEIVGDWESQDGEFIFIVLGFCDKKQTK